MAESITESMTKSMTNYKMIFQYDGTKYNGFQRQGNTSNTICEKIENILNILDDRADSDTAPVELHASGRTDAGVHALGQVANFKLINAANYSDEYIMNYINSYLPADITVLSLTKAADRFHARLNATGKTYAYHIDTRPKADVFNVRYSLSHPQPLDVTSMKSAADKLVGTHDFRAFTNNSKTKKSTVRTINSITFDSSDSELVIRYNGDGFLYNMVRILTGTLILVGEHKISASDVADILASKNRALAGPCVAPTGLFLEKVEYN